MEKGKIFVHADDFGISDEISNNILDTIQNGVTNSISIVTNTDSFQENAEKIKAFQNLTQTLHINIVEGKPLASKSEIPDIVNQDGEFKYSFFTLWLKYVFASKEKKGEFREQLGIEIAYQIQRYMSIFETKELRVDSHMHLHMIPFVFDLLLEMAKEYPIKHIRIPCEKRYIDRFSWRKYISVNLVKHVLLNFLSNINAPKLKEYGINRNDFFIGVLSTGNCGYHDLKSGLEVIRRGGTVGSVEVLFHPGGIRSSKSATWTSKQNFKSYYSSPNRSSEKRVLMDFKTKETLLFYENLFNH